MNVNELINELEESSKRAEDHGTIAKRNRLAVIVLSKQQEEIEYWKEMFEKAMSVNEQIRYLETQVYGGTTK